MPPSPVFYNQNLAHILVNGTDEYYLDSPEVTLKPSDTIELLGVFAYNAGDYGKIGMGIYVYDKDTEEIRCIAWGEGYYDSGDFILMDIYDRTKWKAAELCFFEKSVEIRVISWYWDDDKSKWVENDWLIYAHDSEIEYGFKVKVERKCCDWLCTSRAKVFKIKVEDEYGNSIENANVELCFNSSCVCSSTDPGYESHKTDKNGEVWIEKCGPGVFDPQDLAIVISKSGYVTMYHCKKWSDISDCDTIRLLLPTLITTDITITVLDSSTSYPIEKAKVELYEYLFGTLVETKYTDSYGKAQFKNLDSSMTYYVVITKDCYKKYQSDTFFPADKTFKITPYKHCFKIKVIDLQGYAIQDAKVEIYDNEENFITSDTTNSEGLTDLFTTDEDPLIIKITKSGYVEYKGTIETDTGTGGETIEIVLYEEGKGDIEVTVEDVGGNPIKGFDVYYREKNSDAWRHGCSVFDGETNKCTIKDVSYGDYIVKASNPDYGDATASIAHFKSKTTVAITLGAPTHKCSVKFRVYSREGGALVYSLTPMENVSVTLECKDINYSKTIKTNEDGEADFGEIDLQNSKRTFHYRIYYNEYWQTFETDRTFTQGHSYDIEIHMERCEELIPGWERMIMSWLGIETENLTCSEAESLAQQFTSYVLIGLGIFFALFLLSQLD